MTDTATLPTARDTRWKPGQSGNPLGRPKGSARRNALVAKWTANIGGIDALSAAQATALDEAAEVALRPRRKGRLMDEIAAKNFILEVMERCGLLDHGQPKEAASEPTAPGDAGAEIARQIAQAIAKGGDK
jgi:hypothetical protein